MKKIFTISAPVWVLALAMTLVVWGSVMAGGDTPTMGASEKLPADSAKIAAKKGILDGKVYVGEIGAQGVATGTEETIKFIAGMFYSSHCEKMGFRMAAYTTTSEGDLTRFKATLQDDAKNRHEWEGTIRGDVLDATVKMTSEKQPTTTMWAKATLEKTPVRSSVVPGETPSK